MGDIIRTFAVRAGCHGAGTRVRLYFDCGSPYTFIKRSVARRLGKVMKLVEARPFRGLGNGGFRAASVVDLEIRFLGTWCPHIAYVVADEVLEPDEDMLVGHDLMQRLNIRLDPRGRDVVLDRASLRRSLRVR